MRTSNVEHPVNSLAKLLLKHPFNRKLQILFPLPIDTVQAISTAILSGFYYRTQLNLSALVDVAFIQANLVDASLFCASADANTRVAITPNGCLHLIVSKEQYQCVGLAGERIFGTGRAILLVQSSQLFASLLTSILAVSRRLSHQNTADEITFQIRTCVL